MPSLRLLVLFLHVAAVIVALGSSLFSTFALAPVLAEELDPPARLRVARRVGAHRHVILLGRLQPADGRAHRRSLRARCWRRLIRW